MTSPKNVFSRDNQPKKRGRKARGRIACMVTLSPEAESMLAKMDAGYGGNARSFLVERAVRDLYAAEQERAKATPLDFFGLLKRIDPSIADVFSGPDGVPRELRAAFDALLGATLGRQAATFPLPPTDGEKPTDGHQKARE